MLSCTKLRRFMRLRQFLRRWTKKSPTATRRAPSDVPSGHVAVCVGSSSKRFVVRTTYLNHPVFKKLLDQAQEEYGFTNSGPLALPCEETLFEEVIRHLGGSETGESARFTNLEDFQRFCRTNVLSNLEVRPESRPLLLRSLSDMSVC